MADEGSQTILELRAPSESLGLPFKVHNGSNLLLAFRQLGTPAWEMLGVGEEAPFAFDSTPLTGGRDRRRVQQRRSNNRSASQLARAACADMSERVLLHC